MEEYLNFLRHILKNGEDKGDRTGTGTTSLFGYQMRFNFEEGFPAITTKKIHWPSVIHELLWFISGETNIEYLQQNKIRIWNEWADENGDLGPVYGKQWRNWEGEDGKIIDQLENAIELIKTNPNSRRIIISAWNVGELDKMALMPCHAFFQFYVNNGKLSCQLYQRSADAFLGVPFNIASYSLLLHMIAHVMNFDVGEFVYTVGDLHLYSNHIKQAKIQLKRSPYALPQLAIKRDVKDIFSFRGFS